jgi:lipoyl(octanoyl) transferase
VTWHGLALNVDPDLAAFARFRPCGLDGAVMTSMAAEGVRVGLAEVRGALVGHAGDLLGGPFAPADDLPSLLARAGGPA